MRPKFSNICFEATRVWSSNWVLRLQDRHKEYLESKTVKLADAGAELNGHPQAGPNSVDGLRMRFFVGLSLADQGLNLRKASTQRSAIGQ